MRKIEIIPIAKKRDVYLVITAYLTSQIERYWKGGK